MSHFGYKPIPGPLPLLVWMFVQRKDGRKIFFVLPNFPANHPAYLKHFNDTERPCESICKRIGWKDLPKDVYCCDESEILEFKLGIKKIRSVWKLSNKSSEFVNFGSCAEMNFIGN